MIKRENVPALLAAAIVATLAVSAAWASGLARNDDTRQEVQTSPNSSRYVPVLHDDTITYGAAKFALPKSTSLVSLGDTRDGFVATLTGSQSGLNSVTLFTSAGEVRSTVDNVYGIAIADLDAQISAYLTESAGNRYLNVVDVTTGSVLETVAVSRDMAVMAVGGNRVALSDNDHSYFWDSSIGFDVMDFAPDNSYVLDFNSDLIVLADPDGVGAEIFDESGANIAQIPNALSASLSGSGLELAGVADSGDAYVADTDNLSEPEPIEAVEAFSVMWTESDDLIVTSGDLSDSEDLLEASVCHEDGEQCQDLPTPGGEIVPVLPNNGVGQLVARSY